MMRLWFALASTLGFAMHFVACHRPGKVATVARPVPSPARDLAIQTATHTAPIELFTISLNGSAALTIDELGGTRFWPALDGSLEPRVIWLNQPARVALLESRGTFTAASIDSSGGLEFVALGERGNHPQSSQPLGSGYVDIVARDGHGFFALREDQVIDRIEPQTGARAELQVPRGVRLARLVATQRGVFGLSQVAGTVRVFEVTEQAVAAKPLHVIVGAIVDELRFSPDGNLVAFVKTECGDKLASGSHQFACNDLTTVQNLRSGATVFRLLHVAVKVNQIRPIWFEGNRSLVVPSANLAPFDIDPSRTTAREVGIASFVSKDGGIVEHSDQFFDALAVLTKHQPQVASAGFAVVPYGHGLAVIAQSRVDHLGYRHNAMTLVAVGESTLLAKSQAEYWELDPADGTLTGRPTKSVEEWKQGPYLGKESVLFPVGGETIANHTIRGAWQIARFDPVAKRPGIVVTSELDATVRFVLAKGNEHPEAIAIGPPTAVSGWRSVTEHKFARDSRAELTFVQSATYDVPPKLVGVTYDGRVIVHMQAATAFGEVLRASRGVAGEDETSLMIEYGMYRSGQLVDKIKAAGELKLSPDGKQLLQTSDRSLALLDLQGNVLWSLAIDGSGAQWSERGEHIVSLTSAGFYTVSPKSGRMIRRCGWQFGRRSDIPDLVEQAVAERSVFD